MTHPKISPELIARAAALSTPELCDGMEPFRAMHYEIKPLVGDRVVGQAFTADLPMGSSKLAARMIDEAGAGDILVLAGRGDCRGSLWGDYKSLCASLKKLSAERGISVIMATHAPEQAFLAGSLAAMLKGGTISAWGAPSEVITEKSVSECFGMRVKVVDIDRERNIKGCMALME